ncbi:MAG: serine/threonine protein kinase [Myxococcales bacterium]|nr:serine/threonine protein kinase [Myxococcales bacterium]
MNTSSHPSLRNPPELPVLGADRFEILERIGAGGMGTVYKAVQKSVGRLVAVKVLSSEYAANAAGVARFVREATVVSRLVHPNIVSMIEFGRDPENNLLLVMELLEGEPLRQTLRRERRLPVWRAVQISMQVLAALRIAHGAGVVHRDLKPENIFITNVDGADHAKVLDFGVAKMLSHEVGHETTAGSLVGTLKYMAPEQIAGDPPDARVDLYALGVLLYEMLAGTLPYEHKERVALLRAILNDPPVPITQRAPEVPQPLAELVMRAISKLTIDRFQSAEEFRAALAPFAMAGPDARPPAFPITQEIRLPPKAPSTDRDNNTRASTPNAISARQSYPAGDQSGAKILAAPPPNPSGISSGGLLSSDIAPPVAIPGGPAFNAGVQQGSDSNYTTGAGLSAATHRSQALSPKRSNVVYVIGAVVIAAIAASAGVVIARGSTSTTPNADRQGSTTGNASSGSTVMVTVRTTPAGASLRDTATGEQLCAQTPCMVPVRAGGNRHVRASLGASSMEVVLDTTSGPIDVPLGASGPEIIPTQPIDAGVFAASTDAGVRRSNNGRVIRRNTNSNNGSSGSGNNNGAIPMFGVRPGQ